MHPNAEPNDVKQGRRNVGRAGGGRKKSWGQENLWKTKKIITSYKARTYEGRKGLSLP